MKKILFSVVMVSSALFAYCDPQRGGDCTSQSELFTTNQSIVNSVVVDTPKTDLITSSNNFAASVQYLYSDDLKILNIPVNANIGSNFGVEANIPLLTIKDQIGDTNTGVGDISVGGNFHFGNMNDTTGLNITTLLYKSTTGDSAKGLGSDKPAYTLSHKIGKYVYKEIAINGVFAYTLNDKSVSGDSYLASVGGSMPCLIYSKLRTNAKLSYVHIDKGDNLLFSPEVKATDLWISWDLNQLTLNVPVSVGLKIPLQNEIGTVDADKKFLFYISVTGLF
jgi:hypothetical protein